MLMVKSRPHCFDLSDVLKFVLPPRQHAVHALDIPVPSFRKKYLVLMKTKPDAELNYADEVWDY